MKTFLFTLLIIGSFQLYGSEKSVVYSFHFETVTDTPIKDCEFLRKMLDEGALDTVVINFIVYIVDYKATFWDDNDSISIYLDDYNVFNGRVWHIARNRDGGWLTMVYYRNNQALFFNMAVHNHTLGKVIEKRVTFLFSPTEVYYPPGRRQKLFVTSDYGRLPEQYWKWNCF